MKYCYGSHDLQNKERGEQQCYLLTNGLGGYSSLTLINSLTRNDHALFMGAVKAPDLRYHLVSRLEEELIIGSKQYTLSSQSYVQRTKDKNGEVYLVDVTKEYIITFTYLIEGVEVKKEIVVVHNENTVGVRYTINNPLQKEVTFTITPCYQFVERGQLLNVNQPFDICEKKVSSNGITMSIHTNNDRYTSVDKPQYNNDLYYEYDARDGRFAYGCVVSQGTYYYEVPKTKEIDLVFTLNGNTDSVEFMIKKEIERQNKLFEISQAKTNFTKSLVQASDQFVVKRESIDGLTLMAGYPFFLDWGRDTMYAIEGCCIYVNRFDETKNILRTFASHLKNGVMPNLFPEGDNPPLYNTVDASLLFIQATYLYYERTNDIEFINEIYSAVEEIIHFYKNGTDFDIKMDTDGLISAGSGLMQLTWMDIRYEDILPTPRHGKPVEVNAYWYSALQSIVEFSKILQKDATEYQELAKLVKKSFSEQFWNDESQCLKDVISGELCDNQIRCNQIWAVSVPFSPLDDKKAKLVVERVYEKLYTPQGLRSLCVDDEQFVPEYSGSLKKRDLSYHQGTVWTFPLGSYFKAYLKVNKYSSEAVAIVKKQLGYIEVSMREGCVGQLAEIYDGLYPAYSRGCFGQGWSIGEILKIALEVEKYA